MPDIGLIITWIIIVIAVSIIAYLSWKFLFSKELVKYRQQVESKDFLDLLDILKAIMNEEYRMYEEDILQNRMTITNANFENYVTDMSKRIYESLSQQFFDSIEIYITRDMVIRLITRSVKNFFQNKITASIE